MAKYFFCNKFVNEMFLGCNIKNLFGSREVPCFYTMHQFAFDMDIAYR